MTERRIRTNLIEYAIPILLRNKVAYILHENKEEDFSTIETNLTSDKFHRMIERAMCEKESKEIHGGRQVISYYEWRNRLYDGRGFHMLKKDSARFLSEITC